MACNSFGPERITLLISSFAVQATLLAPLVVGRGSGRRVRYLGGGSGSGSALEWSRESLCSSALRVELWVKRKRTAGDLLSWDDTIKQIRHLGVVERRHRVDVQTTPAVGLTEGGRPELVDVQCAPRASDVDGSPLSASY